MITNAQHTGTLKAPRQNAQWKDVKMKFLSFFSKLQQCFRQKPGYLTRKNKFSEKEYAEVEKYATRKRGNKDKLKPESLSQAQPKEARPGDAAIWGGGFQGLNMQSLLAGRGIQPVRDEAVGLTPSQAGIQSGPRVDPKSTLRDPDNLKIKTWESHQTHKNEKIFI